MTRYLSRSYHFTVPVAVTASSIIWAFDIASFICCVTEEEQEGIETKSISTSKTYVFWKYGQCWSHSMCWHLSYHVLWCLICSQRIEELPAECVYRVSQILAARLPGRLNFVPRRLVFLGPRCGTGFMWRFWCLCFDMAARFEEYLCTPDTDIYIYICVCVCVCVCVCNELTLVCVHHVTWNYSVCHWMCSTRQAHTVHMKTSRPLVHNISDVLSVQTF
jgi:hypothetical protein